MNAAEARWAGVVLRRRFPVLMATVLLVTALALALAVIWPPTYRADATLLVQPTDEAEALPDAQLRQNLGVLTRRMMTRATLLEASSRLGLHDERLIDPDAVLRDMRERTVVHIEGGGEYAITVRVGFASPNPRLAAAAANALAEFLLAEAVGAGSPDEMRAASILQREARRLDGELERHAERLAAFREANADRLPERLPALRARLAEIEARLGEDPIEGTDTTRESLESTRAQIVGEIAAAERAAITLDRLERSLDATRVRYDSTLARAASLRAAPPGGEGAGTIPRLMMIESAEAPRRPERPRRGLIAAGGLVLGLLFGLGAALGAEALDPTLRRPRDITRRMGQPPLAVIPLAADPGAAPARPGWHGAAGITVAALIVAALAVVHRQVVPLDALLRHLTDRLGLAPLIAQIRQALFG